MDELSQEGYVLVEKAEGSKHPLGIRARLDTGFWLCCDMHVPPLSWSAPEQLEQGKTLLVSVLAAEPGALVAEIDGEVIPLGFGDNLVVRPGAVYSLRNDSTKQPAEAKTVIVSLGHRRKALAPQKVLAMPTITLPQSRVRSQAQPRPQRA